MCYLLRNVKLVLALGFFLGGCAVPMETTIKRGPEANLAPRSSPGGIEGLFSGLDFKTSDAYITDPPECVAILPLTNDKDESLLSSDITFDQAEMVRRALYAHISPHGKRDVEIPRIDYLLNNMDASARNDLSLVGQTLNCDSLITGNVSEYGAFFMGLFSRVAVGAQLKMIRAKTGEVLWEGAYVSTSNSSSAPMSLLGVAQGVFSAAMNVREGTLLKVLDNLGRTLASSIPDNRIAVLEEPMAPLKVAKRKASPDASGVKQLFDGLSGKPEAAQKDAMLAAMNSGKFNGADLNKLHRKLIKTDPKDVKSHITYARFLAQEGDYYKALEHAQKALAINDQDSSMHFLKGRLQIKLGDLQGAEASIIEAAALDRANISYLNGLGYLNSLRGNNERALAAYQMAVDLDPDNGFSHYNIGVIYYNAGKLNAARDYFYLAGLDYLKEGNYAQVKKTITDLRELALSGVAIDDELSHLEKSMSEMQNLALLNKKKANDV